MNRPETAANTAGLDGTFRMTGFVVVKLALSDWHVQRRHMMKRQPEGTSVTGAPSEPGPGSATVGDLNHTPHGDRSTFVSKANGMGGDRQEQVEVQPQISGLGVKALITKGAVTQDFPECCLVGRRREGGNFEWFGSGVLIHSRIVLTAAHLGNRRPDVVALRAVNRDLVGAEILDGRFVPHPRFALDLTHRDLALMFLASPSTTRVAAVASAGELNAAPDVVLVGFGDNDVAGMAGFGTKRKATVPMTAIRRDANTNLGTVESKLGFDSTHEFVSGGSGVGVCDGDSGGPAYIRRNDGTPAVAGIAARRVPGAGDPCGLGTISTRVDAFIEFLVAEAEFRGIQL